MTWENFAPWVPVVALGGTSGMALPVLALLGLWRENNTLKHNLLRAAIPATLPSVPQKGASPTP